MRRPQIVNLIIEDLAEESLHLERYIEALEQERDQFKEESDRLRQRLDYFYDDMLNWRGIDRSNGDKPCKSCGGSGVRLYGSSTTWRGGIGGQVMTSDTCDECWGSGIEGKPLRNLRITITQDKELDRLKVNNNRLRLAALNAISFMSSGDAKAELRDAYDESPEQSLHEHDAQVIEDFCNFAISKYRYDIRGFAEEFNQTRQKSQEK